MQRMNRCSAEGKFLWLVGLFALFLAGEACAQFSVVSTSPTDGQVRVDPNKPVQVVFNKPLDINANYDDWSDIPIAFIMSPGDRRDYPQQVTFSQNNRQIEFNDFNLQPNTVYHFAVLAAKSTTREDLSLPVAITFTTGDTLPYGLMTGRAGNPFADNTGAIVALYKDFLDFNPVAMTVIDNPDGDYAMDYILGGIYYPMVFKDLDRNGYIKFDFTSDDIGFFDPDQDSIPNPTLVAEGWHSPVVNMTVAGFLRSTARETYERVDRIMQMAPPDMALRMVFSEEVINSGRSYYWNYDFESPTTDPYFISFFVSSNFHHLYTPSWWFPDSLSLPANWIDSDAAIDTAFTYVGRFFVAEFPDANIAAMLEMTDVTRDLVPAALRNANRGHISLSKKAGGYKRPAAAERVPAW
ncbi:Ig-like domain-containing protein, partial [candidate division KSB1 bacterium]|nr:Ig-like domain-containing protein [candidate division KSB1 bacterium]